MLLPALEESYQTPNHSDHEENAAEADPYLRVCHEFSEAGLRLFFDELSE